MAHIDNLVERIADPQLRTQLAEEVAKLVDRKDFGLVFQRHRPEDVEVPGVRPRRGDTVRRRSDAGKQNYLVIAVADGQAAVVAVDAAKRTIEGESPTSEPIEQLVVVKDFSLPIYPGLQLLSAFTPNGDKPPHVVIEGENYYALEALLYTHERKIDVIYIDPPYNTGSDDWQYNDRYIDKTEAYRHSKWLAFMERRLVHARRLLKDSGVLFVSIDDNEQAHLRLLLDDIFGQENFLDTIVVELSTTSGPKTVNAQQGTIVKNVEYVHVYRKGEAFDSVRHTPLFDSVPLWDTHYSLWLNDDGTITDFVDELAGDPEVWSDIERFGFVHSRGKKAGTFIGIPAMDKLLAVSDAASRFVLANLVRIARLDNLPASCRDMDAPIRGWVTVEADHRTYMLTRLRSGTVNQVYSLDRNYRTSDDYTPRFARTVIRGDLWKGFYQDMGNVSKEGGIAFANGKKPIRLIQQLIRWADNRRDTVVLDYFGGSGTTTHAVAAMNAADGGHRQSIVITNNELGRTVSDRLRAERHAPGDDAWEAEGVFRKVTKPRIENAIASINGGLTGSSASESVAFFKLTYEDENLVALGRKFAAVAPLLWLKAGATGEIVWSIGEQPWALPEAARYGVLFDTSQARGFGDAVSERSAMLRHIYVVTESESAFQAAVGYLPPELRLNTTRLYSDYLHSFEINGEG
ncbi:site-specific DNA-methyltransferase [Microbacterium lacus]|uniref:site-specific DNA-methyltransferase n=1 Tax=Microbacterium lacus TaxID=415217 RepID=UPI00384E38BF